MLTEQQVLQGIQDGRFSAVTGAEILTLIRALNATCMTPTELREVVSEALAQCLSRFNPDHDFAVENIVRAVIQGK